MLSRASSDAGTRLRRSKSTSTVHTARTTTSDAYDPDVAQHQAVVAATTAFVRAHEANHPERQPYGSELLRSKSNGSRKSQGSHFPPRGSSFRAMNPSNKPASVRPSRRSRTSTMASEQFPSFYAPSNPGYHASPYSAVTSNENVRPSSQQQTRRPSASSSTTSQQIRKARSMYYASSVQTGSPVARPPSKYLPTSSPLRLSPDPDDSLLSVRTADATFHHPRSLAISSLDSPRLPVTIAPGETIDKARDKYLQTFQQRQVKHKPSLLLAPFRKRQDKSKTVAPPADPGVNRQNRPYTSTDETQDYTLADFKPLKEKRSISNSLRDKFKKVFRRPSKGALTVPVQQADARRDYFGSNTAHIESQVTMAADHGVPSPHEEVLHRIKARSPSLENGRAALARPTSRSSNRSLHSETDVNHSTSSRVTSWGNSSTAGTLTQRQLKRLTVIHEAKDSIGSEAGHSITSSPRRKTAPVPGLTAFREPMPMACLMEEASTPVDPKRVFSALMREIDSSEVTRTERDRTRLGIGMESDVFVSQHGRILHNSVSAEPLTATFEHVRQSGSSEGPRPTSSNRPQSVVQDVTSATKTTSIKSGSIRSLGRAIRSTIRTVTPSDVKPPVINERTSSVRGAVRIPKVDESASSSPSDTDTCRPVVDDKNSTGLINFKMRPRTLLNRTSSSIHDSTPTSETSDRRPRKSQSRWRLASGDDNTPKSHSSVTRKFSIADLARRTLPRRLTSDGKSPREQNKSEKSSPNQEETPRVSPPDTLKSPKPTAIFSPLSPSIYSRNTDGASIDMANEDDAGSAVIITSTAVKSYVIGTPSRQHMSPSARSSKDWKAWLSHEVSELDCDTEQDITIHDKYSTPTGHTPTGHRRELTEISGATTASLADEPSDLSNEQEAARQDDIRPNASVEPDTGVERSGDTDPDPKLTRKGSAETSIVRNTRSRPSLHTIPSKDRPPSTMSSRSSLSRPRSRMHSSERMNERFPYIETGRRSSSNSIQLSRHTPSFDTAGSSGSSSSDAAAAAKETPSSRVYSDLYVPPNPLEVDPRYEGNASSSSLSKENGKKEGDGSIRSLSRRPRSLQPLNLSSTAKFSAAGRPKSSLSQYTTSVDDCYYAGNATGGRPPSTAASTETIRTARSRSRVSTTSVTSRGSKMVSRPKSAFDLRSPGVDVGLSSTSTSSRRILRGHAGNVQTTAAVSSPAAAGGGEGGAAKVEGDKENESRGREGSTTPGQRMADRFLRERSCGAGNGGKIGKGIEREDTPAFL